MPHKPSLKQNTDRERVGKQGMDFLNDWGTGDNQDFGMRKVCDEVRLFSENSNGSRKEKRFRDFFRMDKVLNKFATAVIYSAAY